LEVHLPGKMLMSCKNTIILIVLFFFVTCFSLRMSVDPPKQDVLLGYWKIRGLAQPIRFLLEYTATPYQEKLYELGDAPSFDRSAWLHEKSSLGMEFPNLPYLIDGKIKISQSNAILRHIARKNNLLGKTQEECAYVDELIDVGMDFRNEIVRLCYNPKFDELKDDFLENGLPKWVKKLSSRLGAKDWFIGQDMTAVDFIFYELLDQARIMKKRIQHKDDAFAWPHTNLADFLDRFEEIPAHKAYMASDRFICAPINNQSAKFL